MVVQPLRRRQMAVRSRPPSTGVLRDNVSLRLSVRRNSFSLLPVKLKQHTTGTKRIVVLKPPDLGSMPSPRAIPLIGGSTVAVQADKREITLSSITGVVSWRCSFSKGGVRFENELHIGGCSRQCCIPYGFS